MITRKYITTIGFVFSIVLLSGCGGGGGGGKGGGPVGSTLKSLTLVANSSTVNGEPSYVVDGVNASIQYWTDEVSGKLIQALFKSKIEAVTTRVIYDPQTEMPVQIIDETTGRYVVINDNNAGRVDYLEYDPSNRYQNGHAVFIKDGKIFIGEITGKPAFSGQLYGQLSGGSKSGSYTLIATDTSDLTNIREANSQFYDMIDSMFGASMSTRMASSALPTDLSTVLTVAGGALLAGSVISSSVILPVYGAAGAAMILSGYGKDQLDDWIENKFSVDAPRKQEVIDITLSYLVDSAKNKIANFWSEVKSNFSAGTQTVGDKNDVSLLTTLDDYSSSTDVKVPTYSVPKPIDAPPVIATQLVGQAAQSDGSVYMLAGTIDASGEVKANGSSNNGSNQTLTIDASKSSIGAITGSYITKNANGNIIDSGRVDGTEAALGTCQTSTGSGGQGTFSFSHVVGSGAGGVDFFYDAYSIPDAFTVNTTNGQKFSTGGLVSGSVTVAINIVDEPIVFVSVTAPNNGTAWEYELGCLTSATTTGGTGTTTDQEPNNSADTAQALNFSQGTVTGTVNNLSDTDDVFSFVASSTGVATVSLSGFAEDLDLYLAPGDRSTEYVSNNAGVGVSESITQAVNAGETYYVLVKAYDTRSTNDSYTLHIQ